MRWRTPPAQICGEAAPYQNLPVRLHGSGVNTSKVPTTLRLSVWSSLAVGFQPGDAVARTAAPPFGVAGESAARQNLAVRLHRD